MKTSAQLKLLLEKTQKCLIEALVVVTLVTLGLCKGKKKLLDKQVVEMALMLTGALVLVDELAPALSGPLRQGIGFGVGACMVGFP